MEKYKRQHFKLFYGGFYFSVKQACENIVIVLMEKRLMLEELWLNYAYLEVFFKYFPLVPTIWS